MEKKQKRWIKELISACLCAVVLIVAGVYYLSFDSWFDENFWIFGDMQYYYYTMDAYRLLCFVPIGFCLSMGRGLSHLKRQFEIHWPWLLVLAADVILIANSNFIAGQLPSSSDFIWMINPDSMPFHGLLMGLCLSRGIFGKRSISEIKTDE